MQPRIASAMCGQAVCFFLLLCGAPDFLFFFFFFFFLTGIFEFMGLLFGLQTRFYNILMAFWFVLIAVLVWRKGYVQNHCPLVANFGTRARRFAGGV